MLHQLKDAAAEMGMVTVSVPRGSKDAVWNFIALNLDRLRPGGFDGREVICRPEFGAEFEAVINAASTDET